MSKFFLETKKYQYFIENASKQSEFEITEELVDGLLDVARAMDRMLDQYNSRASTSDPVHSPQSPSKSKSTKLKQARYIDPAEIDAIVERGYPYSSKTGLDDIPLQQNTNETVSKKSKKKTGGEAKTPHTIDSAERDSPSTSKIGPDEVPAQQTTKATVQPPKRGSGESKAKSSVEKESPTQAQESAEPITGQMAKLSVQAADEPASEPEPKKKRIRVKKNKGNKRVDFDIMQQNPKNIDDPLIPITENNCPGLNENRSEFRVEF